MGAKNTRAKGSLWVKVKSTEASGQFPAFARSEKIGDQFQSTIEVNNLIGGKVATLEVKGGNFKISSLNRPTQEGQDSWGGIPLRWVSGLLLGQYPCPQTSDLKALSIQSQEDKITVTEMQTKERYVMTLGKTGDQFFVKKIEWRGAEEDSLKIEFLILERELKTESPLVWSAKSLKGQVMVRWKERVLE